MKHKTIRNHKDFTSSKDDIRMRSFCFFVKVKEPSVPGESRYGLIASKKIFKTAVARNLAKRKMRDWIAYNEEYMILDMDYIFVLNPEILKYPRDLGYRDTRKALKRIARNHNKANEQ